MLFVTSRRMRTRSAMRASKHIDPPVSLWAWTKSVIVLNTLLGWLWQMQKIFSVRGRKEKYGPDIIRLSRRRYRIIKKNHSLQLMRYMDAGWEKKWMRDNTDCKLCWHRKQSQGVRGVASCGCWNIHQHLLRRKIASVHVTHAGKQSNVTLFFFFLL